MPGEEARRRGAYGEQALACAARVEAYGWFGAELFARGIFPDPGQAFERDAMPPSTHFLWYRRPASGFLSGALFTDGCCLYPDEPSLRRVGWAIVQTDELGNVVSAAYGVVPDAFSHERVARGGEDYAGHMLSVVAITPFHVHVDCKGTVGCMQSKEKALDPSNPRRHYWEQFWSHFDSSDFVIDQSSCNP